MLGREEVDLVDLPMALLEKIQVQVGNESLILFTKAHKTCKAWNEILQVQKLQKAVQSSRLF